MMAWLADTDVTMARDAMGGFQTDRCTIQSNELVDAGDGTTKPASAEQAQLDVPCNLSPVDQRTRRLFGESELLDVATHALMLDPSRTIAAGDTVTLDDRVFTVVGTDAGRTAAFLLTVLVKETGVTP